MELCLCSEADGEGVGAFVMQHICIFPDGESERAVEAAAFIKSLWEFANCRLIGEKEAGLYVQDMGCS